MATSSFSEEEQTLTVRWSGKEYTFRVCGDDSVGELKRRICEVTNVLPKRQKLLYPKVGPKLSDDSLLLSQLPLKSSIKMTMVGTVEDGIIVDQEDAAEVVDDFELVQDEAVDIKDKEVNKQKLRPRISQYKIARIRSAPGDPADEPSSSRVRRDRANVASSSRVERYFDCDVPDLPFEGS